MTTMSCSWHRPKPRASAGPATTAAPPPPQQPQQQQQQQQQQPQPQPPPPQPPQPQQDIHINPLCHQLPLKENSHAGHASKPFWHLPFCPLSSLLSHTGPIMPQALQHNIPPANAYLPAAPCAGTLQRNVTPANLACTSTLSAWSPKTITLIARPLTSTNPKERIGTSCIWL